MKDKKNLFKKPSIIVSNHIWHADGFVIGTKFFRTTICHMAAKDRFSDPKQAFIFRHFNCIPIDRQQLDTSWIHQALGKLVSEQENIAIYPEGRHEKNGEILPFHSGITTIATLSHAPIVMIYIDGPYHWIYGNRIRLMVSDDFELDQPTNGITANYINEQTLRLHNRMIELQEELWEKYPKRRKTFDDNSQNS